MNEIDWVKRDIENAERWLKEETDELPFLIDQRRKYFRTDRGLSDKFAEAIAASERAIKSLREEVNDLYGKSGKEEKGTRQDSKRGQAAGRLQRVSYGGVKRTGLLAEDPDQVSSEIE